MKKLLMAAIMLITISGVAMSQTSPTPKKTHKESQMKKSDSTSTASGTHKTWKKKHSTKHT